MAFSIFRRAELERTESLQYIHYMRGVVCGCRPQTSVVVAIAEKRLISLIT